MRQMTERELQRGEEARRLYAERPKEQGYLLKLSNVDTMKGWCLELFIDSMSDDDAILTMPDRFENVFRRYLGRDCRWFLQGRSDEWVMFEFWTSDQDVIMNAIMIAMQVYHANTGVELNLDIV